jgi:PAS domain S-box-containing protein
MEPYSLIGAYWESDSHVLWEDDERVLRRGWWRQGDDGERRAVLFVVPAAEHPSRLILDGFRHEYGLRVELEGAWAVQPLTLVREAGRIMLVLEDPGGEPLEHLLGAPMEMGCFLRLAIAIAVTVGKLHQRGLVHKDIKPANILANQATGELRLTGFGIASGLPRERQSPRPPETLAGTLAYMAPEQTGRMNRSVDSRSDLYALGVTLYRMLTGTLPFAAIEPMEWVHCHLARCAVPPAERLRDIPATISAIVMKLLAKSAEDRYQTAAGLERDLLRCQSEWQTRRQIDEFRLGERDLSDRLRIPERLYGRQGEVETLLGAFNRIAKGGSPELILVSGYSGVGKSSVVNELQPVLVPQRGLFASGKFDQFNRDVPYSTLAQAFESLIRPLLSRNQADLAPWQDALREALGPNAKLIVELVPAVKLMIGEPPQAPELPSQDAQQRFRLAFRRLIGVFARPEHPLALFLDDLQWLDAATLDVLEDLLTGSDLQHLLLIGAYRDNEVDAAHPLMRKLEALRSAGGKIEQIILAPLAAEHLVQLIVDSLHCEPGLGAPLGQLVHEKTGGNPFFAIQFIHSLVEEGMLAFRHDEAQWSWDFNRIRAKQYTDNVVNLMVGRLNRLPVESRKALQQLACLGNVAETAHLSIALDSSEEEVHASLCVPLRLELLARLEGSYKFIHDRVQEAAYSLIPEERRAEVHLQIGRSLAANIAPEKRQESIFEIVNQLNRGTALVNLKEERDQLAELNLIAGKRAKGSAAYVSAIKYLTTGAALLGNDGWGRRRELLFQLELERAECEFLTGELAGADERLIALSHRPADAAERAALAFVHMGVCTERLEADRAVAVALDYLRQVGIACSPHPLEHEVRREYEHVWSQLGSRTIEEVVDLPPMSDPQSLATVRVLTKMWVSSRLSDVNLSILVLCKAVNLSLERGNCDASCLAFVLFGQVVIQRFRDYKRACRFGQVGYALAEDIGLSRFQAGAYSYFADVIAPWIKHARTSVDVARRASVAANKIGDFTYANDANATLTSALLIASESLSEVQREANLALTFAQKSRFSGYVFIVLSQLALIQTLRGLTAKFGCLDGDLIEELSFERNLTDNPHLVACWYWIRKMQARYFAGEYQDALECSAKAQPSLWNVSANFEEAEYHFYSALCRAACCDSATADDQQQHLEELLQHQELLDLWAATCPENFENRAALVGAEIARIKGCDLDAMRLYEVAIRSARINGFINNEGLAYERASAFYRARGFDQFAETYLRNSSGCYATWGAEGKVRQLERLYPSLRRKHPSPGPVSTITTPVEGLDLATVIQVSQTVSSEIVLEKLFDSVMRKAMEHAGAERGILIVPQGDKLHVVAESKTSGNNVIVRLTEGAGAPTTLPESILRYVIRTHESVILDDAASRNSFSDDPYLLQNRVRSILCLPLLNQARLSGVLYLENNLAGRVFTPERSAVLKVLVSQAAISIENTRLYRDLEDREAKIRRLVDANIIGIFIWELGGLILEANDAFLTMLGYNRDDLVSPGLRWTDLTPPEWRERDQRLLLELSESGALQPFEKEYFRKDGRRVPVLIGVASFGGTGHQGVAYVVDLSERRRAEDAVRQLESDLAHMNRLSMMGELSATLAHEVKQPIATARNNARAAQNFLKKQPPDLKEVGEAVGCLVGDVDRAADIIDRISEQIRKAPLRKDHCDLNSAIKEVVGLAHNITMRSDVSVQTQLAEGMPPVQGDRVQLQQVVLNLMLNAVEAMASVERGPRELLISTEQDHMGVRVAVRDSGPGIEPEHFERVFRSFFTTKPGGTGMGLSICRSIIEAHGGRLWAEANEPRGAVFWFTLPETA